jgi:hypothetical protein
VIKNNYMILNREHKSDTHEFGRGFYFTRHVMNNLLDFKTVNDRIFKIRVQLKYYTLTLISTLSQLKKKMNYAKKNFVMLLKAPKLLHTSEV